MYDVSTEITLKNGGDVIKAGEGALKEALIKEPPCTKPANHIFFTADCEPSVRR
jgi:hypothetical protein